ncbi:MAG: CPBP family intramembrane glutamic endopeptidase [Actinomycetota bacterium]
MNPESAEVRRLHPEPPRTGPFPSPPPAAAPPRTLVEELAIVLALSLFASAVYAILSFTSAPVNSSVSVAVVSQTPRLVEQIADIVLALPPVWLVFYLLRRNGERASTIGMAFDRPRFDLPVATILALLVGAAGIVVYIVSVRIGHNRLVVPVPPLGQWWTIPVLVLSSAENALLEETVVLGYMVTRLQQIGTPALGAMVASAVLRGSYHLYQGWGGFTGNLAMGLFFGLIFLRWRRTWPMVIAHTVVDIGAGVLYIAFRNQLPGLLGG